MPLCIILSTLISTLDKLVTKKFNDYNITTPLTVIISNLSHYFIQIFQPKTFANPAGFQKPIV